MAWTNPGFTPGTSIALRVNENTSVTFSPTHSVSVVSGVTLEQLLNPIYGIPFATTNPSGDLEYTGGGGSSRPSSGFLYPRGY